MSRQPSVVAWVAAQAASRIAASCAGLAIPTTPSPKRWATGIADASAELAGHDPACAPPEDSRDGGRTSDLRERGPRDRALDTVTDHVHIAVPKTASRFQPAGRAARAHSPPCPVTQRATANSEHSVPHRGVSTPVRGDRSRGSPRSECSGSTPTSSLACRWEAPRRANSPRQHRSPADSWSGVWRSCSYRSPYLRVAARGRSTSTNWDRRSIRSMRAHRGAMIVQLDGLPTTGR